MKALTKERMPSNNFGVQARGLALDTVIFIAVRTPQSQPGLRQFTESQLAETAVPQMK